MAEIEERENFVDLLKQMLRLDIGKRITPGLLLEDPLISMINLSHSFPDSFYMKSGCEMMEVCLDQASTSTASQVVPAWHNCQEHPLVLEIAKAVSSRLSIHDDPRPSQPQQLSWNVHKEKTPPELQYSSTSEAQSYRGKKRQKKRDTFEAIQGDESSPESVVQEDQDGFHRDSRKKA